jgi:VWFA-related protein
MHGAIAFVLGAAITVVSAAQEPPRRQIPRLRAGVESVVVDVYPTRDGVAVNDLTKDEFELLEDGVPQRIESFERVAARLPGAPAETGEPATIDTANDAAGDPRNRLFVLYLDTYHTPQDRPPDHTTVQSTGQPARAVGDSPAPTTGRITNALSGLFLRLVGPDDLVGLYAPEMSAGEITFSRRATFIEDFLRHAAWQRLGSTEADPREPREEMYKSCYPKDGQQWIWTSMIARRRESLALEGLRNLIVHLQGIRDARTMVLVVSRGWKLYRRDERLMLPVDGRVPGQPGITVSQGGQPVIGGTNARQQVSECDRDRVALAELDNARTHREILKEATRANVAFYPIDPAGLRAGSGMSGAPESLRRMATATGGMAIVDTNDLDGRIRRIIDDVSSYYLLGYTPTNTRHDGTFRSIAVRVKRPGVSVRARSGYQALTEDEVAARGRPAAASMPVARAGGSPRDTIPAALAALAQSPPRLPALAVGPGCGSGVVTVHRRGPFTGPVYLPTTDPVFRRAERLRIDVPVSTDCTVSMRVLDRTAQPLPVPVTTIPRVEAGATIGISGELSLAPLAPAVYLVEVSIRRGEIEELHFLAIRIVP